MPLSNDRPGKPQWESSLDNILSLNMMQRAGRKEQTGGEVQVHYDLVFSWDCHVKSLTELDHGRSSLYGEEEDAA